MQNKYPIGGYAPGNYTCICCICKKEFQGDKQAVQCEPCAVKTTTSESDARQTPPSFNEMIGLIKKLFTDYLEDVVKSKPDEIEKAWERYKTLNHLYQDNRTTTGAVWVKAPDFNHQPNVAYHAKDSKFKGAGTFDKYNNFRWGDGSVTAALDQDNLFILDESPSKEREAVDPDELWDEFSEYIANDIDSCQEVAGSSVMTKQGFKKMMEKIQQAKK
jgi:hypothetical protein